MTNAESVFSSSLGSISMEQILTEDNKRSKILIWILTDSLSSGTGIGRSTTSRRSNNTASEKTGPAKHTQPLAVVVAHLVERSLSTLEIRVSNPINGKRLYLTIVYRQLDWKIENKEKESGNDPFKNISQLKLKNWKKESSRWHLFTIAKLASRCNLYCVSCIEKTKIKKKEAGKGPIKGPFRRSA